MKRLLAIILLAIMLLCALPVMAQKQAAWSAALMDYNDQYVFLEFYKDGVRTFAERYPIPGNGMAGVSVIVRDEIKRLAAKEAAAVLVKGPVTPAPDVVPPDPPPPPDPALVAFAGKVEKLRKLQTVLKPGDAGLIALQDEVAAELKAHPEWADSI